MSPRIRASVRVPLAGLVLAALAACSTAPAAPDLTPPRAVDAKTQLEYGSPSAPRPGRY